MADDKLTDLYNSPEFIDRWGKDKRIEYIEHFDKLLDRDLAAKQLQWCLDYKRVPRPIADAKNLIFYEYRFSPKEAAKKVSLEVEKQMRNDEKAGIPPYPSVGV